MFSIAFFLYLSKYIQDFLKILCFFSEVLEIKKNTADLEHPVHAPKYDALNFI